MAITYRRADERPPWEPTVYLNGVLPDLSSGHTFTAKIAPTAAGPATVTKTTGIVGYAAGVVQVNWVPNELDIDPGTYELQLICKRTSDNYEWSIADKLIIKERL